MSLTASINSRDHFNISCVLAKKANAALAAVGNLVTIKQAVTNKRTQTQNKYDADTAHRCTVAAQASWSADIATDLKNITIPR